MVPEKVAWKTMVFHLKGRGVPMDRACGGGMDGLRCRDELSAKQRVNLHDKLHGFRSGRDKGTAT